VKAKSGCALVQNMLGRWFGFPQAEPAREPSFALPFLRQRGAIIHRGWLNDGPDGL
jgi:hypothetical protein